MLYVSTVIVNNLLKNIPAKEDVIIYFYTREPPPSGEVANSTLNTQHSTLSLCPVKKVK